MTEALDTFVDLTPSQRHGIIELRAREVVKLIPREVHGQSEIKKLKVVLSARINRDGFDADPVS